MALTCTQCMCCSLLYYNTYGSEQSAFSRIIQLAFKKLKSPDLNYNSYFYVIQKRNLPLQTPLDIV